MSHSRHLNTLSLFITFKPLQRKFFVLHCPDSFVKFILDCVYNIVKGTVILDPAILSAQKIKKFEKLISSICDRRVKVNTKRKLLATNQGINLIVLITAPIQNHFSS